MKKEDLKIAVLKGKTDDQLAADLQALEKERFNLRFRSATSQLDDPSQVRRVRRSIARIKTLQNERQRSVQA